MYGLDEYYDELLLEAKSPEEIKKVLEYQFVQNKGVPSELLDRVFEIDPTKKKSYTKWLLSKWDGEKDLITKIVNNGDVKRLFEYFQSRQNNGLNLAAFETVDSAIGMLPEVDRVLTKNGNGGPEDDYDIVYDSPEWKIATPHTYEASKKLGKGCKWCTAEGFGDSPNYFNNYTKNYGPLWINFKMNEPERCPVDNKEYPYTRYQFCFESGDYRDCRDIEIESFSSIGLPEGAIEFYKNTKERYGEIIENDSVEPSWEDYEDQRNEESTVVKVFADGEKYLTIFRDYNNEYIISDNDPFYVYDEDDIYDPVCWYEVENNENCIENKFEDSDCVLLQFLNGRRSFFYYTGDVSYIEVEDDVDELQINGEYVTFIGEDYRHFCMFSLTKNKMRIFKSDGYRRNSFESYKITKGLRIKGGGVYDSEHLYIDILTSDTKHCLIKLIEEEDKFKNIILNDWPENEQIGFEVVLDKNGNPTIKTRDFDYGYESFDLLKDYMLLKKINSRYCIVKKYTNGYFSDEFNIFDKEKNRFLFEEPMKAILTFDSSYSRYIIVKSQENKMWFYDIEECHVVGDEYRDIVGKYIEGERYIFAKKDDGELNIFKYTEGDLNQLSSIKNIIKTYGNYGMFLVRESPYGGQVITCSLYSINGTKIIGNFTVVGDPTYFVVGSKGVGEKRNSFVYGLEEKKLLFTGGNEYNTVGGTGILKGNGKAIVFSMYHNDYFVCDEVLCSSYGSMAFTKEGRFYIYSRDLSKILPQNGVDCSLIQHVEPTRGYGFMIKTFNDCFIYFNTEDGNYEVQSYNDSDKIELAAKTADAMFGGGSFDTINEVKNRFNSFFKRINDVKF